jgi:nucleoside-triphosphatase THEP1
MQRNVPRPWLTIDDERLITADVIMFALLIGDHREGKTSACRRLAQQARALGLSVGGIIQPAVYQADVCIGYEVVDLASGRSARLAAVGTGGVEHVGRFQFFAEGLAFGKAAIRGAASGHPQLVIVDEVGPLELAGKGWSEQLDELLAGRERQHAVVPPAEVDLVQPPGQLTGSPGGVMLWSVRRKLAAEIGARWAVPREAAAQCHALCPYDLSGGADTIISDIIMALQRRST